MNDNYEHADNRIIYIPECIPGPVEKSKEYEQLFDDYNSEYEGCDCEGLCKVSQCKCIQKSHNFNTERISNLEKDLGQSETYKYFNPIFECVEKCSCSSNCINRVVQKGPIEGLLLRPSSQKGLCLYTTKLIPNKTFICEYAGEILTKSQSVERTKYNEENNCDNYIFCLNEHASTGTKQTFVDPSCFGNIGRYINHSCNPNSHIVPVRCESLIPKLAIFSSRDIKANEEITFSYGSCTIQNDSKNLVRKKCFCNSAQCCGYLPFNDF